MLVGDAEGTHDEHGQGGTNRERRQAIRPARDACAVESKLAAANDLKETAHRSARRSGKWHVGSLSLFILALACFGLSRCRGERSSSVAFSILAIAYILWLMLLV